MSECVVQIDMPENCETCHLRINDSTTNVPNWICAINQWPTFYCRKSQSHADEDKYLHDCPILCSLPEEHGRLVSEKSVRWAIDDIVLEIANRTGRVGMTKDETMEYINNLCTIVPAETERSEK